MVTVSSWQNVAIVSEQLRECRLINKQQETHHKVGLGVTPCRLIRKRCRFSSLDKFEDAFDAAVRLFPISM